VEVWADFREESAARERVKQEIAERLAGLDTPAGYRLEEGESAMMRGEATRFLRQAFVVALFLIAIVLVGLLDSYMQPLIIMVSVALSIGGVLGGYAVTGQPFVVVMSGVGCIALAGVVVNNGIVLIDYLHILLDRGTEWRSAIVEAATTRLRPVMLTAITTILGILPMAMGISIDFRRLSLQVGSESSALWQPFAWAMIFGLGFATLTTLAVVPALLAVNYHFVGGKGLGFKVENSHPPSRPTPS
jgi:multidrug efflux pump subunit AcrB